MFFISSQYLVRFLRGSIININFIKNAAKTNNIDIQVKTLPCCSKYWPLGLSVNLTVAQIAKYEKKLVMLSYIRNH